MIIGITGGFGCGKSTVLALFKQAGATVYSADRLCHEIYEAKEKSFFAALINYFGDEAINPDGSANRKFIASRVFSNQKDMDFLNQLFRLPLHDRIVSIINEAKKSASVTAIEIPLLFEEHYEQSIDKVLTVFAPDEARKAFLAKRGFDFEEMQRRDLQQMPLAEKVKLADYVIVNISSEDFLKEQFNIIWNNLTR